MSFFTGTPESYGQRFMGGPEQRGIYNQLTSAAKGPGAGGAFGQSADYYRGLLSNNSEDFNAFAAPEMRRYQEQTIPDIAEQFAGMGAGGLSSSGFQNASVSAGTDLSERLAAIRAQLRQQGAHGLQNIGTQSLGNYYQNTYTPAQEGFLGQNAGKILGGIGTAVGGPALGAIGGALGSKIGDWLKPAGTLNKGAP